MLPPCDGSTVSRPVSGLEYREVVERARSSRSFRVAFVLKSGVYLVSYYTHSLPRLHSPLYRFCTL